MVDRERVVHVLSSNMEVLRKNYNVSSLALFGSVARGEAVIGSDIDILVSFDRVPGIFKFIALKEHLEQLLFCQVDLVTENALKRKMKRQVLSEAVYVA